MRNTPTFPQQSSLTTTIIAALAAFVAVGLLGTVAFVFQRDGAPLERLAAAERACAGHAYVSARQDCMNAWLAARSVAGVTAHNGE